MKRAWLIAWISLIAVLVVAILLYLISMALFKSGRSSAASAILTSAAFLGYTAMFLVVALQGAFIVYVALTSSCPGAKSRSERTVGRTLLLIIGLGFLACSIYMLVLTAAGRAR